MNNSRQFSASRDEAWSREFALIEAALNLCPQWFERSNIRTGFAADLMQFLLALKTDLQGQANPLVESQQAIPELAAVEFALQSLPLWEEYLHPSDYSAEQLRRYLHQRRSMLLRFSSDETSSTDPH